MKKLQRFLAILLACVLVLGAVPGTVLAADTPADVTYYVAKSSAGGSSSNDGSQDHPLLKISDALAKANSEGATSLQINLLSEITVTQTLRFDSASMGSVESLTINGGNFSLVYAGEADIGTNDAAFIVGADKSVTFQSMNLMRQDGLSYKGRILRAEGEVILDGANLKNGLLSISDVADGGSAIFVANGGHVSLIGDTQIINNQTIGSNTSGAIFVANGGTLSISNADIKNNAAADKGDGIYVQAGGNMDIYSEGDAIVVADKIYLEPGANATVGADDGQSGNIKLSYVWLATSPTSTREIATLGMSGETRNATINVETDENYHFIYRLISGEAGYSINHATGTMDEDGWTDIDGTCDIRYMVYQGVPGLYLYYYTLGVSFHDVTTLTTIDGVNMEGASISYYNPEEAQNYVLDDGLLTIPEIAPSNPNGDYIITFAVNEEDKEYRIPTPDQIAITLDGATLVNGSDRDYLYEPNYEDGTATITVFASTIAGLTSGQLDFQISGEKYAKLTLEMNGPLYTMNTSITGQTVSKTIAVAENAAADGTAVTYTITRNMVPMKDVTVVLYEENTSNEVATAVTGEDGIADFSGLSNATSYYYVIYYSDTFDVIARDEVRLTLSTLEGQKMSDRVDFEDDKVAVSYDVADAENRYTASSVVSNTTADTKVSYYVDVARDTITFIGNPGEATTADTLTFYYTGEEYVEQTFSKTMETNAVIYGNLPNVTMVGYTFQGWFTDPVEGDRIESSTGYDTTTSAKVLYAHWTPNVDTHYEVRHWVERVEEGTNPTYVPGTTEEMEQNGKTYYLWETDAYDDGISDEVRADIANLLRDEFSDPANSWWTMDGLTRIAAVDCKVLADGSSVFDCFYDRNVYTLSYDPTEGQMTTSLNTQQVKFGSQIGDMLVATRAGYRFSGWFYQVSDTDEISVTKTNNYTWIEDIEVFAKWTSADTTYTIKVYVENKELGDEGLMIPTGTYAQYKTVTKDNDGQPLSGSSDVEMEVAISSIDALTFDGFTYKAYSIDSVDPEAVGSITAEDSFTVAPNEFGTTIVYLYYSRNTVNVTFYDDEAGLEPDPFKEVTLCFGDKFVNALPDPTPVKPGYDFTSWVDENGNPVTGDTLSDDYTADGSSDLAVYPVWTARVYYVTYVPGDHTEFDVSAMGVGYTINSEVSGGYTVAQPLTYDEPMGTLPRANRIGYEFTGWWLQDAPGAEPHMKVMEITPVTIDTVIIDNDEHTYEDTRVLYAEFAPYEFTLELDPGDGTCEPTSVHVVYGEPIPELPVPELTGYTFVGWMLDTEDPAGTRIESGDTWIYMAENGSTVHAHAMYYANIYTYTLDLNDVNSDPAYGSSVATLFNTETVNVQIAFDSPYALVLGDPQTGAVVAQRNGYDFLGWSTSRDLADLITDDSVINTLPEDSTLYAMWQPRVYTLRIDLHNGQMSMDNAYSWIRYAEQYYNDYERTYNVPDMAAEQVDEFIWDVPVIYDTIYGDLDVLTRENYKFEGYKATAPNWYRDDDTGNPTLVIDGQIITSLDMLFTDDVDDMVLLDAVWTPYFDFDLMRDDAHFADDGSTGVRHILRSDITELPVAECEGYTFLGWWDDVSGQYVDLTYVLSVEDYRVFKAYYTPNITFDGNGGKVIVNGQPYDTYTIGLSFLIADPGRLYTAEHETKTFYGWIASDSSDLTEFSNIVNRVVPVTLVASWDISVTFDVPELATWPDEPYHGDRTYTVREVGNWTEMPVVYLDGYEFLGWYDIGADPTITSPARPADISDRTESTVVHAVFRQTGNTGPVQGINVIVTNFGGDMVTYEEPEWVLGSNTLLVTSARACNVILIREGEDPVELKCTATDDAQTYAFTAMFKDGDEVQIALRGDIDLDSHITAADIADMNMAMVDMFEMNFLQSRVADVDLDGRITATDVADNNSSMVDLYECLWNLEQQ